MFANEIGICLKKIHNLLERGRNRDLKRHGLTGTQMEILEYLHRRGKTGCILADIASSFDAKHTSVLHVIKLLEQKGLITRQAPAEGGRYRHICLTEDGERLMAESDQIRFAVNRDMLRGFTEEEQGQLGSLLKRLYQNLKQGEERSYGK